MAIFMHMMRKVSLEIEPYEATRQAQAPVFTHVRSYEVLEVLKMDHVKGIFVDLIEIRLKEGVTIDQIEQIGNMELMSVIRSEGDKHICLVLGKEDEETKARLEGAGLDLIFTTPSLISEDRVVVSFMSSQKDLMKFVEMTQAGVGDVKKISFKKATYDKKDILSVLTDKQRQVMVAAHQNGYYDIPKRIGSDDLAKKLGLSVPTLLEHLRKAEKGVMAEIMAGQVENKT